MAVALRFDLNVEVDLVFGEVIQVAGDVDGVNLESRGGAGVNGESASGVGPGDE